MSNELATRCPVFHLSGPHKESRLPGQAVVLWVKGSIGNFKSLQGRKGGFAYF